MNLSNSSQSRPLPMIEVAKEAILFIWNNNKQIVDSIKFPCVLTIIISILINPVPEKMDLLWALSSIIQTYLYIVIVVKLHRIFLLNETEYSFVGSFIWRKNNTSYLLTTIAIGLMVALISAPFVLIVPPLFGNSEANTKIYSAMILIPVGYVASRVSLVLPSIAINDKINFCESWNISKGNGWKVFILITLFPITFNTGLDLLYSNNIALRTLYSLLGIIILLIEVIILSNTYKKLILH